MPLPSKRDRDLVRDRLLAWLSKQLPAGASPAISRLDVPEGTGMSSETFLFDAGWTEAGAARRGRYVVRLSPNMDDFPVFPEYDLSLQVGCLNLVAAHSDVPVPRVAWHEPDPGILDYPFYVMERVEGRVPPDLPPYLFAGWVVEATPEERAALRHHTLATLAKLHAIDVTGPDAAFLDRPRYGATALEQHLACQRAYYDWARDGVAYPVIERTFAWLEKHRPDDPRPPCLNWGDSRIGNILYRGFEPAAVLDWEMACLGAPEVDLAWMCEMHDFFQAMAEAVGLPGLPDLLPREAVIEEYEALSGRRVEHFDWYYTFAALRFGIVSIRTSVRAIAYGQMEPNDDPDALITNKIILERCLG